MDDGSGGTDWTYDSLGHIITETKTISNTGTFVTGWGYPTLTLRVNSFLSEQAERIKQRKSNLQL
jgi:hypothetical protein